MTNNTEVLDLPNHVQRPSVTSIKNAVESPVKTAELHITASGDRLVRVAPICHCSGDSFLQKPLVSVFRGMGEFGVRGTFILGCKNLFVSLNPK